MPPQMTAAPAPIKIGEHTYEVSPLKHRDIDEVNNWLRSTYIQMARDSLSTTATPREREESISIAMRQAFDLNWMEMPGSRYMTSPDGQMRIIYQGIRERHKDVSFDEFRRRLMQYVVDHATEIAKELEAPLEQFKAMNVGPGSENNSAEKNSPLESGESKSTPTPS